MPYKYADAEMRRLNKRFVRMFGNFGAIDMDELNVLRSAKKLYSDLDSMSRKSFLRIARNIYKDADDAFVFLILDDYDPVVKYVYTHEVDRKRARFAEAFIASPNKRAEVKTALRLWSAMITQYAITVTDKATLQSYIDMGVTSVQWISVEDKRRCDECRKRDGVVYDIDKIPPKPHIGCRCYVVPTKG